MKLKCSTAICQIFAEPHKTVSAIWTITNVTKVFQWTLTIFPRILAKIKLNSFWNRFKQKSNFISTTYFDITGLSSLLGSLTNPTQDIKYIHVVNENLPPLNTLTSPRSHTFDNLVNVFLVAVTNSYARLHLIQHHETIEHPCLVFRHRLHCIRARPNLATIWETRRMNVGGTTWMNSSASASTTTHIETKAERPSAKFEAFVSNTIRPRR